MHEIDGQQRNIRLKRRPMPVVGLLCIPLFALALGSFNVIKSFELGFPGWGEGYSGTEWAFVEYHEDETFTILRERPADTTGREVHIVCVTWWGSGEGSPARAWLRRAFHYTNEPITEHALRTQSKQLDDAIEAAVLENDVRIGLVVLNWVVLIPLVVALPAAGVLLFDYLLWQSRLATRRDRVRNARCPKCVYDLTGMPLPHTSCPECGCTWEPLSVVPSGGRP